jgi:PAS domain S-box-containing protein
MEHPRAMPRPRLSVAVALVALATGVVLFLFQFTKDSLLASLPGLQPWQVDLVPVALGTVIAAVASALVLGRQSAEHRRIVKELASRRRPDDAPRPTARRSPAAPEAAGREPEAPSAERKEAAALRASEARYRVVVEGAPEAICVHRDGVIEFANQAAAALFGFASSAELVGRHYGTLVVVTDRARLERDRTARLAGESVPARFEFRGLRNDGATVWLECRASRVDWQGQPAVVTSLVDISDRKQHERGSGAPEPAPAADRTPEPSPAGAVVITDETGVVTDWNAEAEKIFGRSRGEAVGLPLVNVLMPPAPRETPPTAVQAPPAPESAAPLAESAPAPRDTAIEQAALDAREAAETASRAGREAILAAHETPAAATGASPLRADSPAPVEPAVPVESAPRVESSVPRVESTVPIEAAPPPTPPLASPSAGEVQRRPESPAWTGPEPVDVAALRQSLGEAALSDMVGTFLGYCPERLESLREAVQEGDSNRLARTAYSLKGALGNLGAERGRALAAELEAKGRSGALQGAPEVFAQLEVELERITAALSALA